MFIRRSAYKQESCRVLPYLNEIFNVFIAIFPNKNMFSYIFAYSTSNVQSIETQQPLPIPQYLSVVARTKESHVGFLTYLNEYLIYLMFFSEQIYVPLSVFF